MDNFVFLIKEWNGIAQFIFILLVALFLAIGAVMIFNGIEKFVNHTLPIIFRGWPPGYTEEDDAGDNKDDDITEEK